MALSIHKPGQGYWVRMLTAVFAGTLLAVFVAFLWSEADNVVRLLPKSGYAITVDEPQGALPGVGSAVKLLESDADGSLREIGSAVVKGDHREGLMLHRLSTVKGFDRSRDLRIEADGFSASGRLAAGTPVVEDIVVKGSIAAVVILAGAWLIYRYVGTNPRSAEFLISTDAEMRRVNWSTRRDVIRSTLVVIAAAILLATSLFVIDVVFRQLFRWLDVMRV